MSSILGNTDVEEFNWEPIDTKRAALMDQDELMVSYMARKSDGHKNPLLIIRFGTKILNHLKAKPSEKLLLMQDPINVYNYLLVKAENGYKIQLAPIKDIHQISFRYFREGLAQFKSIMCNYFLNKNGTIRIILPKA